MKHMKLISLNEALGIHFGKRGTPRREQHEAKVAKAIHSYHRQTSEKHSLIYEQRKPS